MITVTVWMMVAWLNSGLAGIPVSISTHQSKARCELSGQELQRANSSFSFVCIESDVVRIKENN